MSDSIKGGNVTLVRVDTPDEADPGQPFEAQAEVKNGALFISFLDSDSCENGDNPCSTDQVGVEGYCVRVDWYVDGNRVARSDPDCLNAASVGAPVGQKTATLTIGQEGTYDVGARVRMVGTGEASDIVNTQITISSEDTVTPPPDDGGGGNGGNGGDGGDGGGGDGGVASGIVSFIADNPIKTAAAVSVVGVATSVSGSIPDLSE